MLYCVTLPRSWIRLNENRLTVDRRIDYLKDGRKSIGVFGLDVLASGIKRTCSMNPAEDSVTLACCDRRRHRSDASAGRWYTTTGVQSTTDGTHQS